MENNLVKSTDQDTEGVPVVALPEGEVPWARRFRSTWIVSSLEGLKATGHFDAYQAHLGPHGQEILSCVAGTWLPIAAACDHYQACERLGLSDARYAQLAKVGSKVRSQWNARVIAELKADGATPWTAMTQLERTWRRAADGGAFGAFKLQQTKVRVVYVGCELFDIPYFRRAVRLMVYFMCRYKGRDASVQQQPSRASGSVSYLVDWK